MQARILLALIAFALAGAHAVRAEQPVPVLRSPVTDVVGLLSAAQVSTLDSKLRAFETRKGAQVALLIVATTAPETVEQFARRVLDVWKLGRKGIDDGALLVVAVDDHAVRIETQYGVEGVLPDVIASRIIRETIVPQFKAGNYYDGISAGLDRMLGVIDGEPLPAPEPAWQRPAWDNVLPIALIIVFAVAAILRKIFGRVLGSTLAGAGTGIVAWLIAKFIPIAVGAGIVAFLISIVGASGPGRWMSGRGGGLRGGGGWSGGGGWGGGGGGGWSGGGGGGGGGGASGRW